MERLPHLSEILRAYAFSGDLGLRHFAVKHPMCPSDVLERFTAGRDVQLRLQALRHLSCPTSILKMYALRNGCPGTLLEKLAYSDHITVKINVAGNRCLHRKTNYCADGV